MNGLAEKLVGAWTLVDWRIEYGDGRVTRPFGADAAGQLLYDADGCMSATVSAVARPRLDQPNARDASDEQKARAFDGYFHYAGNWHVEGEFVIHTISLALNPDMTGTKQRRHARFEDAKHLELFAEETLDEAVTRRHVLAWRRVDDE